MRCNPLTITDGCTRYLIACQGLDRQGYEQARPVFEPAFQEEYGLPSAMRTDNGTLRICLTWRAHQALCMVRETRDRPGTYRTGAARAKRTS